MEHWCDFLHTWSTQKYVDGKSVDEILNLDGVPLWWFYKPFIFLGMSPPALGTILDLNRPVKCKRDANIIKEAYVKTMLFSFKKMIRASESIKQLIAKKSNNFEDNAKKKALFLTYMNYIKDNNLETPSRITNLLKEIRTKKEIDPLILVLDPVSKKPSLRLTDTQNLIYQFMSQVDQQAVQEKAKELHRKWTKIRGQVSNTLDAYQNIRRHLNFFFTYDMIHFICLYYETFKLIIQKNKIKLMFLTGGGTIIDRCALAAASTENIYSLFNPHGYMSTVGSDWCFFDKAHFAIFGQDQQDDLLKRGAKIENVHKTGGLVFDHVQEYTEEPVLDKQEKKILFLTQAAAEKKLISKQKYLAFIKQALSQLNQLDCAITLIKLHPAEKYKKEYQKIINLLKSNNIKIVNDDPTTLIKTSDIIITFRSSVILNSLLLNKPVICLNLLDKTLKTSYDFTTEDNSLLIAGESSNLQAMINSLYEDQQLLKNVLHKQKRYQNYFFEKIDGKAYQRIADLIESLVAGT